MDISSLLIRVIFLLLPGGLASVLYRQFRGAAKRKDWQDLFEVILFSLPSYALYGFFVYLISLKWPGTLDFTALDALFNEGVPVRWQDILGSSLMALGLATLAAYADQFKIVNKIGKLIGATTRFGDEDVWDFFHRSPYIRGSWVAVRDHKTNLYYFCWIEAYSDSGRERELLLRDVSVHDNSSGDCIYKTDVMYLSRKADEFTIEAAVESEAKSDVMMAESGQPQLSAGEPKGERP